MVLAVLKDWVYKLYISATIPIPFKRGTDTTFKKHYYVCSAAKLIKTKSIE